MPFQIPDEELEAILSESWTMLLGEDSGLHVVDSIPFGGEAIFSALKIYFQEAYVLNLSLPKDTAECLAVYFYGEPSEDLEELMETVGEALNIFTGNFMSILPDGWRMETPSYKIMENYQPSGGVYSQYFNSNVGGFHLSIIEA